MIKVKLCAFSDEADPSLEGQIAALKRNNVPYMEMRGVNGKNVTALWTFQFFHIKPVFRSLIQAALTKYFV